MNSIALSPDSKTLAVAYFSDGILPSSVDSFSLGPGGKLTEHGPYNEQNIFSWAQAVDITADSKYVLFGEVGYGGENGTPYTEVGVFPINPDGSLGPDHDFGGTGGLGYGYGVNAIWLSPNGEFLFVTDADSGSLKVTTLVFNESVPSLSYGCIASPRGIKNPDSIAGMATALPSGAGGYLYLTERANTDQIGLFSIDSSTGCLRETLNSPVTTGKNGFLESVATWPPRPF